MFSVQRSMFALPPLNTPLSTRRSTPRIQFAPAPFPNTFDDSIIK
jgi:hypothetical protein